MRNLKTKSSGNYRCPIVFYNNRETILDYANRTKDDIVVQNGGWIGKYFPLLARTAYDMLFHPNKIWGARKRKLHKLHDADVDYCVLRNFLNRTTYPITNQVKNYIDNQPAISDSVYDTVIVGAGVSGLHSAYRINEN